MKNAIGPFKTETVENIIHQAIHTFLKNIVPEMAQIINKTPITHDISQVHAETGEHERLRNLSK